MQVGGSNFKDISLEAIEEPVVLDWLNLPRSACAVSLWGSLHDAEVTSISSNLLERTLRLSCEIEHLRKFHRLAEGFRFVLSLEGVQSARVLRYAIWPGGCTIPDGLSIDDQRKIVDEYQAQWRQESASWHEFESTIGREQNQVLGISDSAISSSNTGPVALRISGQLNYDTYHEVFLRFETLKILGSDGSQIELEEFLRLGEAYWDSYSARAKARL